MDELPPFVAGLVADRHISASQLSGRALRLLQPLFDGGVLARQSMGRGEIVIVEKPDHLVSWVRTTFPGFNGEWVAADTKARARSIALRRSSKAGGAQVGTTILHVRAITAAPTAMRVNMRSFPVAELTSAFGVAACLIDKTTMLEVPAKAVLLENLECFLHAEELIPDIGVALNSSGRISQLLIDCLARSAIAAPLLHFPDYDPVGLRDYLRMRAALGGRVALFVPSDVEDRFASLGDRNLIAKKPRNRHLLEELAAVTWPCAESEKVFRLIKETGVGLEQESLFLSRPRD